jgi:hypothetical protein
VPKATLASSVQRLKNQQQGIVQARNNYSSNPHEMAKRLQPVLLLQNEQWILDIHERHLDADCPPCFRCIFKDRDKDKSKAASLFIKLENRFNAGVEKMHSFEEYVSDLHVWFMLNLMPIFEKNKRIKNKRRYIFTEQNIAECSECTDPQSRRRQFLELHKTREIKRIILDEQTLSRDPADGKIYINDNSVKLLTSVIKLEQMILKSIKLISSKAVSGFGG